MNGMRHIYVPVDLLNFEPEPSLHLYVMVSEEFCPHKDNKSYPPKFLDKRICYERLIDTNGQKDFKCPCFHSTNQGIVTCNVNLLEPEDA